MENIKKDFPIFAKNPNLIYLDSACTSLKPMQVINAEMAYYSEIGACGGRSSHKLGRETSRQSEEAREKVAKFVGARTEGLVWTRNTTEALNIVIYGFDYSKRKKVVTTLMEHHAVLLPLMDLHNKGKIKLELVEPDDEGKISEENWANAINRETGLIVTNNGSNVTGWNQDVRKVAKVAHDAGALICIDGAQGVPHRKTEFELDGVDFLCFSAHKMLGPTGIGALVANKNKLMQLNPLVRGGGTVKTVTRKEFVPVPDQTYFEAGIQHYSGIIGFGVACDYLKKIGMENVEKHEKILASALRKELESVDAEIYGPSNAAEHSSIYTFNLGMAKAHDVALMLDKESIAVRSGFFCAQPGVEGMGAKNGAVRASCYLYNTLDDVRKFGEALKKIKIVYD